MDLVQNPVSMYSGVALFRFLSKHCTASVIWLEIVVVALLRTS